MFIGVWLPFPVMSGLFHCFTHIVSADSELHPNLQLVLRLCDVPQPSSMLKALSEHVKHNNLPDKCVYIYIHIL